MGAVMEFVTMNPFMQPKGAASADAVRDAARVATAKMMSELKSLGASDDQIKALGEAGTFALTGNHDAAQERLVRFGFDQDFVDDFLSDIKQGVGGTN